MKTHRLILGLLGTALASAHAQSVDPQPANPPATPATETKPAPTAPATDSASTGEEEIVVLTPFEVVSEDTGYFAEKGLSSGRLATDLKDSAANVNVFTKDQLLDLGAADLGGLLDYATSTQVDQGDFTGQAINALIGEGVGRANTIGRARGLPTTRLVDYEIVDWEVDNYNIERSDFFLGTDAILFGNGSPGGAFNSTRDSANLRKTFARGTYRFGSHSESRGSVDINTVLIKGKLALRLEAVDSETNSFRRFVFKDRKAHYATLAWQPFRNTSFKFSYDAGKNKRHQALLDAPIDAASTWLNSTDPAKNVATTSATANPLLGLAATNVNTRAIFTDPVGGTAPDFFYPNAISTPFYFGGRNTVTPRLSPSGFSAPSPSGTNTTRIAFLQTQGTGNSIDSAVFDSDLYSVAGPDSRYLQDYNDLRVTFEQRLTKDLFLRAYTRKSDSEQNSRFIRRNGPNPTIFADPYTTGTGDTFNGRLYAAANWRYQTQRDEREAWVAGLAWAPDFGKFGKHQISLSYEDRTEITSAFNYQERVYTFDAAGTGIYSRDLRRINYFDPNDTSTWNLGPWTPIAPFTYTDPVTSKSQTHYVGWVPIGDADFRDTTVNDFKRKSSIAHIQSKWLKSRIVTSFGYREDRNNRLKLEPTYLPNNGAGSSGVVNYTLLDYNGTTQIDPRITATQRSKSASIVVHLDKSQNYSLFFGNSGNTGITSGGRILPDGDPQGNAPKASSKEMGIRLSLLDEKIEFRASYFKTSETNNYQTYNNAFWYRFTRGGGAILNNTGQATLRVFIPTTAGGFADETFTGNFYALDDWVNLLAANNKIDATEKARQEKILGINPNFFNGNNLGVSTLLNEGGADGYEARINLKPTKNLSFIVNYSYNNLYRENVGADVSTWLDGLFNKLVTDLPASVLNAPYVITARPTRPDGNGAVANVTPFQNSAAVGRPAGATPYTNLQVFAGTYAALRSTLDDRIEESGVGYGNRKHKFNVFGRYDFKSGLLQGLSAGGGYTWQSKAVAARLNELGTDGEVHQRVVYSDPVWNSKAFVSYKFKPRILGENRLVRLQLNVENLFQNEYERQTLRYAVTNSFTNAGPLTSLDLDTNGNPIPTRWSLAAPREYYFTTTVEF